jgi:L-alanine-DL-glutamate epimerase-like enolase superfamily enzyme
VENHFVRIETENGSYGLGVAAPEDYVTGESTVDCKIALDSCLESLLLGQDIRYIEDLVQKLQEAMPKTPAARAAVDIALIQLR